MRPSHARMSLAALLACAAVLSLATPALADHHAAKPAAAPAAKTAAPPAAPTGLTTDASHDAAMAEMAKFAMPGPAHELLKSMTGEWTAEVKMWTGPGEPAVNAGTSSHRLIMGGRYLEQRFTSSMFGQPFEGYGLTGFDNRKGRYVTFWVDNSNTEMMTGEGTWDAATKTLTTAASMTGPEGKPIATRMVTVMKAPDTHVFSMYAPMNGQDALMMEITYKRTK